MLQMLDMLDIPSGKGVIFPNLDEIVSEFSNQNKLNIIKKSSFSLMDRNDGALGELTNTRGLVLQFEEGLAVLSARRKNNGPANLENTIGGGPVERYAELYILSGTLREKCIQLRAEIAYRRGCSQEIKQLDVAPYTKHFEWVPQGEFRKETYRWDDEDLYFIAPANKK